MRPDLLEEGTGFFGNRIVDLPKPNDGSAVDLLKVRGGNDKGLGIIVETPPVQTVPQVDAKEVPRDAGKLHEPADGPLAHQTPGAFVTPYDGDIGFGS